MVAVAQIFRDVLDGTRDRESGPEVLECLIGDMGCSNDCLYCGASINYYTGTLVAS